VGTGFIGVGTFPQSGKGLLQFKARNPEITVKEQEGHEEKRFGKWF